MCVHSEHSCVSLTFIHRSPNSLYHRPLLFSPTTYLTSGKMRLEEQTLVPCAWCVCRANDQVYNREKTASEKPRREVLEKTAN